mgnify:CR=1 FL=1
MNQKLAVVFLCLLPTLCLFSQQSGSVSDTPEVAAQDTVVYKNPTGAMLRSLLVPGWGQFYNGKWLKGILVAGAEVGLVVNAYVLNQWAQDATEEDYREFYLDNRNLSFWLLGATILYSMADAYVDAHMYNFDETPDLTLDIRHQRERFSGILDSAYTIKLFVKF